MKKGIYNGVEVEITREYSNSFGIKVGNADRPHRVSKNLVTDIIEVEEIEEVEEEHKKLGAFANWLVTAAYVSIGLGAILCIMWK